MSILADNYKRIMSEIEEKISDPEELKFIKEKMSEMSLMFLEVAETRMNTIETRVNEIETDIYSDDDVFEFEIVCPYCNNEFATQIEDEEIKKEIECPKCHNTIELDWNEEDDEGCTGDCCGCHGCSDEEQEDLDDDM